MPGKKRASETAVAYDEEAFAQPQRSIWSIGCPKMVHLSHTLASIVT